jgi:hypothetical protein
MSNSEVLTSLFDVQNSAFDIKILNLTAFPLKGEAFNG